MVKVIYPYLRRNFPLLKALFHSSQDQLASCEYLHHHSPRVSELVFAMYGKEHSIIPLGTQNYCCVFYEFSHRCFSILWCQYVLLAANENVTFRAVVVLGWPCTLKNTVRCRQSNFNSGKWEKLLFVFRRIRNIPLHEITPHIY